jgi:hypothetical protein
MGVAALIAWLSTVGGGLFLLAVWLIEYDRGYQSTAATRLPIPVISTHAILATGGLAVWGAYLLLDDDDLAWISAAILGVVATLGLVMAARWLRVYQSSGRPAGRGSLVRRPQAIVPGGRALAGPAGELAGQLAPGELAGSGPPPVPPERSFPVPVVIFHGIFATVTIVLVVLTALDIGGS